MGTRILNLNVGLLGHVDSGKTSLAKVLSEISSTASFDKNPQSQERGITIDLGFSSFSCPAPAHLSNSDYSTVQFTLVDCPGHASLIKTIIGGSHIIDMMLLIIDATKGVQTQTAECLIIGEITKKKMMVVLNKVDLLENDKAHEKLVKKMRLTIDSTSLKGAPIVSASAANNNVKEIIDELLKESFIPERNSEKPFLFAIDHCFAIKGKGTVLTGTVLQGCVKLNSEIEIPSIGLVKKVKSMQMFKKPVETALQGDRVGICVTQFEPKLLERGIACAVHYVPTVYAAIMDFNKVRFFKNTIASKSIFHVNIGYENVTAKLTFFGTEYDTSDSTKNFSFEKEYKYIPEITDSTDLDKLQIFVLLEFAKPILVVPNSLAIVAKLDISIHASTCRLAFHGSILESAVTKNYHSEFLTQLKVYKEKSKKGIVDRMINEYEVVGKNMFKKETNIQNFVGMKVTLSSGEKGVLESGFGQSGKFKVRISEGLSQESIENLAAKKKSDSGEGKGPTEILLCHKSYVFDANKRMLQS